jgi:hypothetical protein
MGKLKFSFLLAVSTGLILAGCRRGGGLIPGTVGPATPKPTPRPTSPGANKIAYLANDGSFWLVSPDGKERRLLFYDPKLAGKTDLHFDWSPDASKIIMDGLRLVDLKTGEIKDLPKGETPKWSPKGDKILITGTGFDSENLYLMNADGSGAKLVDKNVILDWGVNHSRNWSPKGDRFVYTKVIKDEETGAVATEIWVADAKGGNKKRVFDPKQFGVTGLRYPTWSPKDNWIAFTFRSTFDRKLAGTDNLAMIKVDGSNLRILTEFQSSDQSVFFPTWSPDRRLITWIQDSPDTNGGIWLIRVSDRFSRQMFKNSPSRFIINKPFSWSPNSSRIITDLAGPEVVLKGLLTQVSPLLITSGSFNPPDNSQDITKNVFIRVKGNNKSIEPALDRQPGTVLEFGGSPPQLRITPKSGLVKIPRGEAFVVLWEKTPSSSRSYRLWMDGSRTPLATWKPNSDGWSVLRLFGNGSVQRMAIDALGSGNVKLREIFIYKTPAPVPAAPQTAVYQIFRDVKIQPKAFEGDVASYRWSPI